MFSPFLGISENPFTNEYQKEGSCYKSRDFTEATGRLKHLERTRGLGIITSPPGKGKTYVVRSYQNGLNKNLFISVYMKISTLTISEFYRELCIRFGLSEKGSKPTKFEEIQGFLYKQYREHRPVVLVIDEAQCLNTSILNDLKMLMNFDHDSLNCFILILCGEPQLNDILRRPIHAALAQRLQVHYDFEGLNDDEVTEYIRLKLSSAGVSPDAVIDPAALAAVNGLSNGTPRVINNIMSDALVMASQHKTIIDADIIRAAAENRVL